MLLRQRDNDMQMNETQEDVYTLYSEEGDITFIMKDLIIEDKVKSTSVIGFYYGEPNEELTEQYIGKMCAIFE